MYKVKIKQFEGPLDLLLDLTSKEKLDITRMSLAQVTDQYLEYIEDKDNISLESLADFLSIASKLILIKSKSLLPLLVLTEDEEEEIEDLEQRLAEYKKFKDASVKISEMVEGNNESFSRESFFGIKCFFNPPEGIGIEEIKNAYLGLSEEVPVIDQIDEEMMQEVISLEEKITDFQKMIKRRVETSFAQLVKDSDDKIEVVVSFLAMLEMVKQRIIKVEQTSVFDDIKLKMKSD
ncbi:segregation and condensation protein A [Patescibacteria group bacterium]